MKHRSFSAVIILLAVIVLFSTSVAIAQTFTPERVELVSSNNVMSISLEETEQTSENQTDNSSNSSNTENNTNQVASDEDSLNVSAEMPSTAQHIEGVGGIDLAKVSDKPEVEVMRHGA